jgi:peptidoglycan/xylan/chitin deacetylase (PgdA/CDA1 family)
VIGSSAILLYHRVAEIDGDPHRLCVEPARFAAHVEHLRRHADIVPLHSVRTPSRRPRVAITFDDGYADNATAAVPVLERLEAPATFFVVAGTPRTRGFWWDRLERLMLDREPLEDALALQIDGHRVRIDVRTAGSRQRAHEAVYRRLRRLPDDVIEHALSDVARQFDGSARALPDLLGDEQLRGLAAHPLFDVGAHTLTHPYLPSLPAAAQLDEAAGARRLLERVVDRAVRTCSFPHGGYDAQTLEAAAAAGYELACSSDIGRVWPWSPKLCLPRNVVFNWSVPELELRLRSLLRARA